MPTISVVIPAYNAENFVANAIQSALAQTYPATEIIVVDDGSKDKTCEVVKQYLPKVRLLQRENGGPAAARNTGIRASVGEWIGLLDADDTWLPHKLERQIVFTVDPSVGIIQSNEAVGPKAPPDYVSFERLWKQNCVATSTALIRRTAFDSVDGFDEDRALISVEDYNLWLRLVYTGWNVATCREKLINYTPAPNSLSRQTERFAKAELSNIENIARRLNLPTSVYAKKRRSICDEYGRSLIYYRQMEAARKLLSMPLKERPTPSRLIWWIISFMPAALLDARRREAKVQV